MFVGDESWPAFVRYELLTGALGPLPGALGYWLRAKTYRVLLGKLGRGTIIGRAVTIRSPRRISLGRRVMIDDLAVLDAKGEGSCIELGDSVLIGRNTILSCTEAKLRIGNFVSIGPFCHFACKGDVTIGSNVAMGSGTQLLAGGHAHQDADTPVIRQERLAKGITIGDGCWIGSGVILLDGVSIGRNCILSAGAVIMKDVPEGTVVAGNPARVVQRRQSDPVS